MSLIVKICGLSTRETLDAALHAGADMVGFVFFPPSPRHLGLEKARELGKQTKGRAAKVALSVDADDATLANIVDALQPDILQLHGRESVARVRDIKQKFGLRVMKAIGVEKKSDFDLLRAYDHEVDWFLFDTKAPVDATRPGGLGRPFDWHLVSAALLGKPRMLSGGLGVDNVEEALTITKLPAVDVSSGVESSPGVKDPQKIRNFITVAREAHFRATSARNMAS
jgi:phosphoribosylanthranilate isomerase